MTYHARAATRGEYGKVLNIQRLKELRLKERKKVESMREENKKAVFLTIN